MAICFIANKDLTRNYNQIARLLAQGGERVLWLSPSPRWSRWLMEQGWPEADILNFSAFRAEWLACSSDKARALAAPYEADPSLTMGHVIRMCRGLSRRPAAMAEAYLATALTKIDEFLARTSVEAVFGEGTWGFEIAAGMVCRKQGIPHICPSSMRIPSDRFGFVDAVTSALWDVFPSTSANRADASAFLDEWLARPRPPLYASANTGYIPYDRAWLSEAAIALFKPALDRGDETLWPIGRRIMDRIKRAWRSKRVMPLLKGGDVAGAGGPFLLICLQHQPEAAVDVFGGFNSDQGQLIELIARMAPAQCEILVREHRGAIGDRPASWYRRIAALPKILLGDPFAPIYPLIQRASAVITVSSTVAFEAALLDTPALLLAPVHYAELAAVPPNRMSHPLDWPLADILDPAKRARFVPGRDAKISLLARIIANSIIGDPAILRGAADETNNPEWLQAEAEFFASALAQYRRRRDAGELILAQ